ncbi:unnamed protein product [Prunus armeniaca]
MESPLHCIEFFGPRTTSWKMVDLLPLLWLTRGLPIVSRKRTKITGTVALLHLVDSMLPIATYYFPL